MNNDTIVAGVGAEGLNDKYEIKILICYLLNCVHTSLTKDELLSIFQDSSFVNYFVFCDALKELEDAKSLSLENNKFVLNALGKETAQKLSTSLPTSLKDNIVSCAIRLIAKTKQEQENEVKIEKYQNGYMVKCIIHDLDYDIMRFELFVPDLAQAEIIEKRFINNPSEFYSEIVEKLF